MELQWSPQLLFERTLASIAAQGREADAWEVECLRAALIMMAAGHDDDAERALEICQQGVSNGRSSTKPTLTIEDFRHCLTMLDSRDNGSREETSAVLHKHL